MKKLVRLIAAMLLACFVVNVACAETVLRFSWWGGDARKQATLKAIALFESKNPGVKIRPEAFEWATYEENLKVLLFGRGEPDVMQINWAFLPTMSKSGTSFFDLLQYKQQIKFDDFMGDVNSGMVKGKLNALPISNTARVFIWQQNTLQKAGVTPPKTWDDLLAMGRAYKQKLGDAYYPLDGGLWDSLMIAHAYIYQKTGKPFVDYERGTIALSPAEVQEWVHFFTQMSENHVIPDWKSRLAKGGDDKPVQKYQEWMDGHWSGNYQWDSAISSSTGTLPKTTKMVVSALPTVAKPLNSGYFGRPSMLFAVSKNSKNPELALKFINFMLSDPDAAKILGVARGVPLSKSSFAVVQREKMLPELEGKANEILRATKVDLPSPYYEDARFRSVITGIFEQVAFGRISEKEAASKLISEGNAAIAKIRAH